MSDGGGPPVPMGPAPHHPPMAATQYPPGLYPRVITPNIDRNGSQHMGGQPFFNPFYGGFGISGGNGITVIDLNQVVKCANNSGNNMAGDGYGRNYQGQGMEPQMGGVTIIHSQPGMMQPGMAMGAGTPFYDPANSYAHQNAYPMMMPSSTPYPALPEPHASPYPALLPPPGSPSALTGNYY